MVSRQEWERRARELAAAQQTPAPRILAADFWRTVFGVPKSSGVGEYVILLANFDKHPVCDCLAGQHRRPCCHAGAVLQAEAQRQEREQRVETVDHDRWVLIEAGQW